MDTNTRIDSELSTPAVIALGLLGAGAAIGLGVVLADPDRRNAVAGFLREVKFADAGRSVLAGICLTIAESLSGAPAPLPAAS